jgi:predicted TIM-barrel fold metal-dependent hydrolase
VEIVDSQIHFGPGGIEKTLACMEALGIRAVLADEFWGLDNWGPGYTLPNGAYRVTSPTAELAGWQHPERFSYVLRVDRNDPEFASIIRMVRSAPHARAIRILPGLTAAELDAFAAGAYEQMFAVALQCSLPVFVFIPGHVELMARYLRQFPSLQFIVDHCGMPIEANVSFLDAPTPGQNSDAGLSHAARLAYFDTVLKLAEFPNAALKWSHAQGMFGVSGYPFAALFPYLRRAVDSFGARRIMWASDHGGNQTGESWAELLFYVIACPDLTEEEKEWLLGRTVRTLLNWRAGDPTR